MARMNVKLLREIKEQVLAEPRRLNMAGWGVTGLQYGTDEPMPASHPPCGTMACIAGWAILLTLKPTVTRRAAVSYLIDEDEDDGGPQEVAAKYLRISQAKSERLFFVDQWPKRFSNRYGSSDSPKIRAEIAAKRIDFFIATNGTDRKAVA